MTAADALMRLGASTAEAIAKVLDTLCPGEVERGEVAVVGADEQPFATLELPAVAVSVAYVDGVSGGNVLLMTTAGARRLAATMSGTPAPADPADELSELELSAVAEAANQMMAAAASATSMVLGEDVAIAPPETRVFATAAEAQDAYGATPHATSTSFRVCGEPSRLVQLVPNAFIVRMTRALGEQGVEHPGGGGADASGASSGGGRALDEALREIHVRVWAELGRTHVSLGQAPELPAGALLELDRKAEDPVDLYVNGLRFGSGRLVLTDEGEWALRLLEVAGREAAEHEPEVEGVS
jgi:flagellar motor switch protein FliN/FliY